MKTKLILFLLFVINIAYTQKKNFTLEDQFKLEYPLSISVSPSGDYVVFNIRKPNFEDAKWINQIYLLNTKTRQIKQLTTHPAGVGNFLFHLMENSFISFQEENFKIKLVKQLKTKTNSGEFQLMVVKPNIFFVYRMVSTNSPSQMMANTQQYYQTKRLLIVLKKFQKKKRGVKMMRLFIQKKIQKRKFGYTTFQNRN